ncbi:hypothetical protein HK099_001116, partial [Clydaea vesicula]
MREICGVFPKIQKVANGFFEWKTEGKLKIPHYISKEIKDEKDEDTLLYFAGLYDDSNKEAPTYTIVTVNSSKYLSFLHERMPCILDKSDIDLWLDENKKFDSDIEGFYPVSNAVSKRVNEPENIVEIKREAEKPKSNKNKNQIDFYFKKKPEIKKEKKLDGKDINDTNEAKNADAEKEIKEETQKRKVDDDNDEKVKLEE